MLCNGHSIVNCCQPLYQKYNLNDLYNHVVGSTCTEFGGHKESADCCKELLQCIVNKCENHDNITIAVERQIPNLSNSEISDLMCSKHQIPDLYMHLSDDLTAEKVRGTKNSTELVHKHPVHLVSPGRQGSIHMGQGSIALALHQRQIPMLCKIVLHHLSLSI